MRNTLIVLIGIFAVVPGWGQTLQPVTTRAFDIAALEPIPTRQFLRGTT
jgi:hypothetical protein